MNQLDEIRARMSDTPLCLCATTYRHLCPEHVPATGNPYARVRMLTAALLECLRAPSNEWQPIESAPKNGLVLLLFEKNKQCVGHWDWYYADGGRGYESRYGEHGAWIEPVSGERVMLHYDPPTHWQPLPPPPIKESK